jgi:hypothetical protein
MVVNFCNIKWIKLELPMSRMHVSKFRTHSPQESDADSGPRILLYLQRDRHMLDSPRVFPACVF